jgi:hypothetical protein
MAALGMFLVLSDSVQFEFPGTLTFYKLSSRFNTVFTTTSRIRYLSIGPRSVHCIRCVWRLRNP